MYLSAERLAVANKAVQETFEETSVAWQAIPHWDTCDPGQTRVRKDITYAQPASKPGEAEPPLASGSLEIQTEIVRFEMTLAQACSPTPDALLAAVMPRTVHLAQAVDDKVVKELRDKAKPPPEDLDPKTKIEDLLKYLIDARVKVEDKGYRAPSCLLTNTEGLKLLSKLEGGYSDTESVLNAANINSLHRAKQLDYKDDKVDDHIRMLVLGRRQRIAHGGAASASPGEEPVDLAVSVPPSLEVVGETDKGYIEFAVRIRYAARIKDEYGVAGVILPTVPAPVKASKRP